MAHRVVRNACATLAVFGCLHLTTACRLWSQPNDDTASLKVVVSTIDRTLWVLRGTDTLRTAQVAVGSGMDLSYAGRQWAFATPRGDFRVLDKRRDPVWVPPDWMYAEVAREHHFDLRHLTARGETLLDGTRLVIRDSIVGLVSDSGTFNPLPLDEHIVFDGILFIPPLNTQNRHVHGELGAYALDLGRGYMLHGTPDQTSIGTASTHGCIRLRDDDLSWLFEHVAIGTPVVIQ
ncbi:MAG: L,D-transpeptidase [Gemmatimonadaceae bacterium]